MRARTVTAADGAQWSVRVAWLPRWPGMLRRVRWWGRGQRTRPRLWIIGEGASVDLGGLIAAVLLVAVLFIATLLFWWLLLPLLLAVLEAVVVVILLVAGIVARVLFRRPWTVVAAGEAGLRLSVGVHGWRRALEVRDEVAERLRAGHPDPVGVLGPDE